MEKEEAQELLKRYRLGECTERELEIISRWYKSYNGNEVNLFDENKLHRVKSEMFANIYENISRFEQKAKIRQNDEMPVRKLYNFEYLKRIAAVVLMGVIITFFIQNQMGEVDQLSHEMVEEKPSTEVLPSIVYLSDGSVVKLKAGSKLEYPNSFRGSTREVTLIGEAFFDVAKNKEKPFIIHSANLTTTVLGTSFNIRAYENDESTEVSVVTGKVSVSVNNNVSKKENLVLEPNQRVVYSRKKKSLVQMEIQEEVAENTSKKAKLIFNETSLEEIVKVLNNYYDVNIKLENSRMNSCLITAELTDEPIEVSLKIITKAIGADYEILEEKIVLKGKGCGSNE